jgi:hypothetical protein
MKMNRHTLTRGGALLCALTLAACADDAPSRLTSPDTGSENVEQAPGLDTHDLQAIPRFTVDLQVHGSMRPGTPVTVTARARANLGTRDAELRIAFPELEVLRRGNGRFTVPTGVALPAAARRRAGIARGAEERVVATAQLPGPGYYRVVATAQQRSDEPLVEAGQAVQETVHREMWILVSEDGGRVTDAFDPALLPENAVKAPGPLRLLEKRAEARKGDAPRRRGKPATEDGDTPSDGGEVTIQSDGFYTWHYTFYNQDTGMYEPVVGADIILDYWTYDEYWQPYVYQSYAYSTDANGNFWHECGNPWGNTYNEWYQGATYARNASVDLSMVIGSISGDWNTCVTTTYEVVLTSMAGQIYSRMTENMQRSTNFLGYSRPRIKVTLDAAASNSFYTGGSTDRITMKTTSGSDHVWGQWGQFIMAHELGHAVHEKALNGNAAGGSCPSSHYLNGAHNLACAYSEGFGNFLAAAIRSSEIGYYYTYFQNNYGYPGQTYSGQTPTGTSNDGSIIEGAVAAFLLDLTDSDFESHDLTAYPGSYVAQVIRSCEVYRPIFWTGSWIRATGVDHLVHCFENQVDGAVTGSSVFFTTRSPDPTQQRESAFEPGSWNRSNIRTLWRRDLYGL